MPDDRAVSRWVTAAAAVVAIGVAAGPPAAWFFFSYERAAGNLEAEAELTAHMITQIIGANPELWEFERVRLGEYLARRPRKGDAEIRRIVNFGGEVIAESVDPLPHPRIRRSLPLRDAGEPVGTIEISRSVQPLLRNALFLSFFLLLPAAMLFQILRTLPLDALRRAEGELRRERDTAQKYLD